MRYCPLFRKAFPAHQITNCPTNAHILQIWFFDPGPVADGHGEIDKNVRMLCDTSGVGVLGGKGGHTSSDVNCISRLCRGGGGVQ